jgi:hypothetical protein
VSGVGVGYAVDEHWVPALYGSLNRSSGSGSALGTSTGWSLSPGLRYVFGAPSWSARPFVDGNALLSHAHYSLGFSTQGYGAALATGLQLRVSDRFSVDPYVRLRYAYLHQTSSASNGFTVGTLGDHMVDLNGGFELSLWL